MRPTYLSVNNYIETRSTRNCDGRNDEKKSSSTSGINYVETISPIFGKIIVNYPGSAE